MRRTTNCRTSGERDLVDEEHVVGQLPLGEMRAQQFKDAVGVRRLARVRHHHQDRTLVPLGVWLSHYSSLRNTLQCNNMIFQIH